MDTSRSVVKLTKVGMCLELLLPRDGAPMQFVQVVISTPRREGTLSKTWLTPEGQMDSPTWADICSFVFMALSEAIETVGGVQMVFDLTET